jgi:type IV pilus assembly protein PilW
MSHAMHRRQHGRNRQGGMSLPELMIGMTLGLLILLGLTSLFVQSKRSFKQDELTARMQEDARFAMGELRHDIGMAGFWANALDGSIITEIGDVLAAAGATAELYTYTTPLTVADDAAAADTLLGQTLDDLVAGTDAIAISKVSGFPAATAVADATGSTTDANVAAARTALLTNSGAIPYLQTNGVVAVMTTANDAPSTAAATLVPAEYNYWRYDPEIYWVRDYAVTAGDGIPTLVRKYLLNGAITTESIAQGVEDMQIEYGIDTDTDGYADRYIAAPTAAQMAQVTTCRIYLLMRSTEPDENYTNARTYTYSNAALSPYTPADNYYRRMFSTTVKVRNNAAHLMLNL